MINCFAQALLLSLFLCGSAYAGQSENSAHIASPVPLVANEQIYSAPVINAEGQTIQLQVRVCYPAGDHPARLVVLNHGSPPSPADRPNMKLGNCSQEAAQWFLSRGYAVAFALRRGYGATGGDWAEGYGKCSSPDYVTAGLETARDIDAVVTYATSLPLIQPNGVVVVGQSAGGWGTIAYDSMPHSKVAAFVVMAGGRGGHKDNIPNTNCHPERLIEAVGRYGATASTPMLWIYTANDSYFGPPLAQAMYQTFVNAGGKAEFVQPGAYGDDGHHLFFGKDGSLVWGPIVEQYLAKRF